MHPSASLFLDSAPVDVHIAARTDRAPGSGSAQDPLNGTTQIGPPINITLSNPSLFQEALANTAVPHGFSNGDMITISAVQGDSAALWNCTFAMYGVAARSFKYWMYNSAFDLAEGQPVSPSLSFCLDQLMREKIAANAK